MPALDKFVLGFIFNSDLTHVLLLRRKNKPYQGLLNGVGGKIGYGEHEVTAIRREFAEEVSILVPRSSLKPICVMRYPSGTYLSTYAYVLPDDVTPVLGDTRQGHLAWYDIKQDNLLSTDNTDLAGEGNVSYLINYARIILDV